MQTLDITLAANDVKAFDIGGSYFELIEGVGAVDVNFVDSNGSRARDLEMLDALPGYWVSGPFSRFELKNKYGAPQTVRVMYGAGVGGSRRIQGNVKVVDQSIDRSLAGTQFFRSGTVAAAAGLGNIIAIHTNGSSKRLAVRSINFQSTIAGSIVLYYGTGGGTSPAVIFGAGGIPLRNKRLGGADSDSRVSGATVAGVSPTTAEVVGLTPIARIYIPANDTRQFRFENPVIVEGTVSLIVSAEALNRDLSAVYDVEEVTA